MSSRTCGSRHRGPAACSRSQHVSPPVLNAWHLPHSASHVKAVLRAAAVEQDVEPDVLTHGRHRSSQDAFDMVAGLEEIPVTPRRRMNRKLKQTASLLQVRVLLESDGAQFDSVNTSHALHLVAKMNSAVLQQLQRAGLLTPEGLRRHTDEHVRPCLAILDSLVATHIDQFEPWDTALCLWSYATLDYYDRGLFELLTNKALQQASAFKPVDCVNVLVAFGRWGHYHPDLLMCITQALLDQMYDTKPAEVSQALWSFAKLRVGQLNQTSVPGRAFLEAICEYVASNMHAYGNQELSTVLWSLAKLRYYPGRLFLQHAESLMLRRLRAACSSTAPSSLHMQQRVTRQHTHRHVHQSVNGHHAAAGQQHSSSQAQHSSQQVQPQVQLTDQPDWMSYRAAPDPQFMAPTDIAVLLWAFGQLRYKAALLLDELPLCLGAWLPQFSTKDICAVLTGYTHARHYHQGVMEALASVLAPRLHTLTLSELLVTLWSFGIFQHWPNSEPRFFGMLSSHILGRMVAPNASGSRPQTLALIAKSCANLQFRPEALLQHVVEASATRLNDFRPDEMAHLLYGVSHLASRAPACDLPPPGTSNRGAPSALNGTPQASAAMPAGAGRATATVLHPPPDGAEAQQGQAPMLQPDEMQLFHGVVWQCMRLLDEPRLPYGHRDFLHHKVLNSIILSCLRIGYTPWALIDFAETKGLRLIQPHQSISDASPANAAAMGHTAAAGDAAGARSPQSAPAKALVTLPGRVRSGHHVRPPADFDKPLHGHADMQLQTVLRESETRRRPRTVDTGSHLGSSQAAEQWEVGPGLVHGDRRRLFGGGEEEGSQQGDHTPAVALAQQPEVVVQPAGLNGHESLQGPGEVSFPGVVQLMAPPRRTSGADATGQVTGRVPRPGLQADMRVQQHPGHG